MIQVRTVEMHHFVINEAPHLTSSIPNTLYSIFYTIYSILYTLYSILYTLYSILYTLYFILYALTSIPKNNLDNRVMKTDENIPSHRYDVDRRIKKSNYNRLL